MQFPTLIDNPNKSIINSLFYIYLLPGNLRQNGDENAVMEYII